MTERRKHQRRRMLKSGSIFIGTHQIPCTVRNLSELGGCLEVQTTIGIPAEFGFALPNQKPQACKVMWRDYTKLGVHFRSELAAVRPQSALNRDADLLESNQKICAVS